MDKLISFANLKRTLLNFWHRIDAIKYDKQTNGIPKTDLASDIQHSLSLADSAIQGIIVIQCDATKGSSDYTYGLSPTNYPTETLWEVLQRILILNREIYLSVPISTWTTTFLVPVILHNTEYIGSGYNNEAHLQVYVNSNSSYAILSIPYLFDSTAATTTKVKFSVDSNNKVTGEILENVDSKVKDIPSIDKGYLLGHTSQNSNSEAVSNYQVYMLEGKLYSQNKEVVVTTTISSDSTSSDSTQQYTLNLIDSITRDSQGLVLKINTKTINIPSVVFNISGIFNENNYPYLVINSPFTLTHYQNIVEYLTNNQHVTLNIVPASSSYFLRVLLQLFKYEPDDNTIIFNGIYKGTTRIYLITVSIINNNGAITTAVSSDIISYLDDIETILDTILDGSTQIGTPQNIWEDGTLSASINPEIILVFENVETLNIELNAPIDNMSHLYTILLSTSSNSNVTFSVSDSSQIIFPSDYEIEDNKTYEISILYVNSKYYLKYVENQEA